MPPSVSTSVLLDHARRGDRQALGELLDKFRNSLCDLARQLLSPELAQKVAASDLVQETCIDAMRDFASAEVAHVKGLEAWLVTLLAHNLIDWQRKFNRSKKRNMSRERPLYDLESKGGLLHAISCQEPSPEVLVTAEESRLRLEQTLQQLSRGYREIILWRHHEKLSWKDIAQRLGRSEDAARMLGNRAVRRLKRLLREIP